MVLLVPLGAKNKIEDLGELYWNIPLYQTMLKLQVFLYLAFAIK